MVETIGLRHRDQINMEVLESLRRDDEFGDRGDHMPLDFGLLTRETFPGPFADIMSNIWPHKFITNGFTGAFNSWVPEAMDGIEYATTVRLRDEGPGRSIGDVYKQKCGSNL